MNDRNPETLLKDIVLKKSLEWNTLIAADYGCTIDKLSENILNYSYFNLDDYLLHYRKGNIPEELSKQISDALNDRSELEGNENIKKLMLNSLKRTIQNGMIPLGKNFTGMIICGFDFKNIIFESNCFESCVFYNCSFVDCEMDNLVFSTCKIIGCEMNDCSLQGTQFIKSALFSLNFMANDHSEQMQFNDCSMFNCQFISNEMDDSIFTSNLIQSSMFLQNSMRRNRFTNTLLSNTNINQCNLKDSFIRNSNLYNVDFTGSDLRNMITVGSEKSIIKYDSIYEVVFEDIDYSSTFLSDIDDDSEHDDSENING